jgi:exonuclease V gamma subunit
MNNSVTDLLQTLGGLPNWKYQLGVAQLAPEEQQNAYQYALGQSQLANQLQEFQQQQALAQAQQQFQQQYQTTGQQEQYGLQSGAQNFNQQQTAQQNALQNWLTQLFGPGQASAQIASMLPKSNVNPNLQNQIAIAQSGLPYFATSTGVGVGGGETFGQVPGSGTPAGTGYRMY